MRYHPPGATRMHAIKLRQLRGLLRLLGSEAIICGRLLSVNGLEAFLAEKNTQMWRMHVALGGYPDGHCIATLLRRQDHRILAGGRAHHWPAQTLPHWNRIALGSVTLLFAANDLSEWLIRYTTGTMLRKNLSVMALALLLAGCTQVIYTRTEGSATASSLQIRDRLSSELKCKALELAEQGGDHFVGTGRNDTGEFTITVVRENGTINYHGKYNPPSVTTFSGSVFWQRQSSRLLGGRKARSVDSSTHSSP